ncbi:MAG: hypothetical protein A2283_09795 [Lentisphaerae bacterium RIFOXYA12_FULL_48_11]|nr:MAG: hypothetical protein A2283_09795 [Lentisphaerae bacterium RIFOXYA12_FULL_48_11]
MFHNPYIASGGGDIFPIIIIIVAIIAQIIKAAKGTKPTITQPDQRQSDGGYTASEDELKKFLETLSGNIPEVHTSQPPALPPPIPRSEPPPIPAVRTSRPVAVKKAKETGRETSTYEMLAHEPEPAHFSPSLVPLTAAEVANIKKADTSVFLHRGTHPFMTKISGEIRGRESLKKAILLREILGPCLALRRPGNLPSGI